MCPLRNRRRIATGLLGSCVAVLCVNGSSSVLATVRSSVLTTPTPELCPNAMFLQSTNGTDYAVIFGSNVAQTTSFTLTLYSKDATYSVTLPAVSMTTDASEIGRKGFRSTAIDLRKPAGSEIVAARVQASAPIQACDTQYLTDVPSSSALADPQRFVDLAETQLESAAVDEIANGAKPIDLQPTPKTYNCSEPFVDLRTVHVLSPVYPNSARLSGITGSAVIEIFVSDENEVHGASIYKSSGNPDLDQAAILAAIGTTYMAEVFDCQRIPGNYLFRGDFAGR